MMAHARLPYFHHMYNVTWINERAVEVPMALHMLKGTVPADILEVGNVLQHYGYVGHTVVDRFERASGVVNCDIRDYAPGRTFHRVISISTLEHIGVDDGGKPESAIVALEHCCSLLASGGLFWCSFLLGDNPALDRWIESPTRKVTLTFYHRQLGNLWYETQKSTTPGLLCVVQYKAASEPI